MTDTLDVLMRHLPDYIQMQGGFSVFKVSPRLSQPLRTVNPILFSVILRW